MTESSTVAVAPANQPQFLGHPVGLYVCFLTEMWERFSFYGMKYLLLLYLTKYHLFSDAGGLDVLGSYAGLVYARRQWDISAIDNAELVLQKNSSGELELSLQHEQQQQLLLTDLKTITDECADCVAPLTAAQFPVTLRLATYQKEQGAH